MLETPAGSAEHSFPRARLALFCTRMMLKSKIDLSFNAALRHFAAAKCMQATCGSAEPDGATAWSIGNRHFPESVF
eukprot:1083089-Pelagomonas_calceolata.AAC.3